MSSPRTTCRTSTRGRSGCRSFPQRQIRFMAKAELFRSPLWPILSSAARSRCGAARATRRRSRPRSSCARDGEVVAIFPEGTRREKGLVKKHEARPHTGAARVALEADVPLIPAAIAGTDRITRLGPLRVAYGAPIELDDLRRPRRARGGARSGPTG